MRQPGRSRHGDQHAEGQVLITPAKAVVMAVAGRLLWPAAFWGALVSPHLTLGRRCSDRLYSYFTFRHLRLRRPILVRDLDPLIRRFPEGLANTSGLHQTLPGHIRVWVRGSLAQSVWEKVFAHEIEHAVLVREGFPKTCRDLSAATPGSLDTNTLLVSSLLCPVALLCNHFLDIIVDNRLEATGIKSELHEADRDWYADLSDGIGRLLSKGRAEKSISLAAVVAVFLRYQFRATVPHGASDVLEMLFAAARPEAVSWAQETAAILEHHDWESATGAFAVMTEMKELWGPLSPLDVPTEIAPGRSFWYT